MAGSELESLARNPWLIIVAALFTGGAGGTFLGRPDPATGTQLNHLREEVEEDCTNLRERIIRLEYEWERTQRRFNRLENGKLP